MDTEPPLQSRDQSKGVRLSIHLQIPAKSDSAAEVTARPEGDFFQERYRVQAHKPAKNAAMSRASNSGSSAAAKCPPLGIGVHRRTV